MASIGPYIIEAEIGRGGMGVVFRARHAGLDRPCALKVIQPAGKLAEMLARRFLREARLMTRIVHPGVVRLFDFGPHGKLLYIAMELLDGTHLEDWIQANRDAALAERDRLALGIARGVGALHELGIVHRDLKPFNVMVTTAGEPKVMDLGLARTDDASVLTRDGAISGTPAYMAPEAGQQREPPPSYDVYALGLILHRLYTGENAFEKSPLSYVLKELPIPEPRFPGVGPEFAGREAVIRRCLEVDPERRPPDANELAAELTRVLPVEVSRAVEAIRPSDLRVPAEVSRRLHNSMMEVTEQPAHRAFMLAAFATALTAVGIHHMVQEPAVPSPVVASATASPSPGSPAPSYEDWLSRRATLRLDDQLSVPAGAGHAKHLVTDPYLKPFAAEIREALMGWEQARMAEEYFSEVEYWPDPPLSPGEAGQLLLECAGGDRPLVSPATVPPGPVRRLQLRLRPGESYRLRVRGRAVPLEAPPYPFARNIRIQEGLEDVIVLHFAMGRACVPVVVRSDDGRIPPERDEPTTTSSGIHRLHHGGIVEDQELTVLVFAAPGPSSRTVLARTTWKKGKKDRLLSSYRTWMGSILKVTRQEPDLGAEMRSLANFTDVVDYNALMHDGRHYAHPDATRMFETLAAGEHPQIRRGAISILAQQYPRRFLPRFRAFVDGATHDEDWLAGVEALAMAGDPAGPAALLERLTRGKGAVPVHWVWTYVNSIPQELEEILQDPARVSALPPGALPLLDQVAAYLGGPVGARHLASLPDERLLGKRHFSLLLMLRLLGTPAALQRLERLASARGTPVR